MSLLNSMQHGLSWKSAPIETSNIGRFRASLGQLFNGFATPVRLARNKPDDYSNFVFMSDRFHDPSSRRGGGGRERVPARRDLSKRHQESASLVFTRGKDFISCTIDFFFRLLEIGLNSVLERKDLRWLLSD